MKDIYYDINNLAPVYISVYDRLEHLKEALKALELNCLAKYTSVYITSDNYYDIAHKEKIEKVRQYLKDLQNSHKFKELIIFASEKNKGMDSTHYDAVSEIYKKYDKIIFFEDDIVVSNTFLEYMNNALEFYKDDKRIYSIASYLYDCKVVPEDYKHDVFLYGFYSPWGVGTWRDRRHLIERDCPGILEFFKNKEELKRFNAISPHAIHILHDMIEKNKKYGDAICCYNMFKKNLYTLYPIKAMSVNRGFDGSGENCFSDNRLQMQELVNDFYPKLEKNIEPNLEIRDNIARHFYSFKYDTLIPFLKSIKIYVPLRMLFRLLKGKNPNFKIDEKVRR